MNYNNTLPLENDNNKSKHIRKYIPERLKNDGRYQAWRDLVLTEVTGHNIHFNQYTHRYIKTTPITKSREYDFLLTVIFNHRQSDHNVINYTSLLLRRINKYCSNSKYAKTGRYIHGFAIVEPHLKSLKLEGCLHIHIMGYFPDTFDKKPTHDEFKSIVKRARRKLNAIARNKSNSVTKREAIKEIKKARKTLTEANNKLEQASDDLSNTERKFLKESVDQSEKNLTEAKKELDHLIFSDKGVKVDEIYDAEGVLNYLSKHLCKENLDERIMVLGPNGLDGYIPSSTRINRNAGGLWNESSETDGNDSQGSLRQSSEPIH